MLIENNFEENEKMKKKKIDNVKNNNNNEENQNLNNNEPIIQCDDNDDKIKKIVTKQIVLKTNEIVAYVLSDRDQKEIIISKYNVDLLR
jgi:hypothetical protein